MAKIIIWSEKAQKDRVEIFTFYNTRNQSTDYSKKLNGVFNAVIKLISKFPNLGRTTNRENIKVKITGNYSIFYKNLKSELHILTIWDNRRDPNLLEKQLPKQ